MRGFSIGKLAKAAGVSVDTIRFYEKSGLLPLAERRPSGFRLFEEGTVRRLLFIRHARDVGFSLQEISDLLRIVPARDAAVVAQIIQIIQGKLARLEEKLVELERWRHMLRELHRAAASTTILTQSVVDFFESEVRDAVANLPRSPSLPGDSHDIE